MFRTHPRSLKSLLDDSSNGKIQLPDFQRGWVWDDDRIRGLLASISRGFPVGALMMLEAGGNIQLRSRMIEGAAAQPQNNAEAFLLDGQQRLTSLYLALSHAGVVNTRDSRGRRIQRRYYVDMRAAMNPNVDREDAIFSVPENRIETRDFGRAIVLDLSRPELEFENHMMPTEQLLDSLGWILEYNKYWANRNHPSGNLSAFLSDCQRVVLDPFSNYDLPVITLDKQTPREAVCTVFEKVNTGGVTLSMFDLVTAIFAAQNNTFSLRDDWNERRIRLHRQYGVLKGAEGNQFLQAVALLSTQARHRQANANGQPQGQIPAVGCRKNDILGLNANDYRRWADQVEEGFKKAAEFLFSQFIFTGNNVPYNTQLVPLATLFVELGRELESANAKAKLERWFWCGIFGEAYGSAVETQYALDLTQVARWIRDDLEPTLVNEANFIPERLLSLRTRNSAAYKGLYALQMKSGAQDWRTAERLQVAEFFGKSVDIHHIFPRRWCEQVARPQRPPRLYNSIINKTPIDASTNRSIGGRAPSDYLPRLERNAISPGRLQEVLRSHWLDYEALLNDQFNSCFVERGQAMLRLIGQAMGRELPDGRNVFMRALIDAGVDEFDDPEDEHDAGGERAYD